MIDTTAVGAVDKPGRLFFGACVSLVATSVAFATVGAVMLSLKETFGISNGQVGWIGGAALWGFAVTQLVFSPLCDTLGMRFLLRLAFLCHLVGTLIMIFAMGFWSLFVGALIIAMGNGLVEASCNPLVAALYPQNKTVKLNQFHVWFPGGIVIGGLASYGLDQIGVTAWQIKLMLILVPTLLYGVLMLGRRFPATEGVQSGVSMGQMFRATLFSPLMILMLVAMAMTASVELGPNRWVPAVLEAGGMAGILVLVWINGLMAILRYFSGPLVYRVSPTGILLISSLLSGIGLYWLSYAQSGSTAVLAASVFAVGVCYYWPTMLGFVSERIPRSGALGLGLMGAIGMATVGMITAPWMGRIADEHAHEQLPVEATVSIMESAAEFAPPGTISADAVVAAESAQTILAVYRDTGALPEGETARALRAIIASGVESEAVDRASGVLRPADNYGGRVSFRRIVPLCGILFVLFGSLLIADRRRGGYRVKRITETDTIK